MTRQRVLVGALLLGLAVLLVRRGVVGEQAIYLLAVLVPSVVLHEVAHGVAALAFGDDTAKRAGRLTLNPVPHIDPLLTVLLPTMLALAGAPVFGAARPVPVNPARMRDPRNHGLLVALAGPATNIVLAAAATLALRSVDRSSVVVTFLLAFGLVNVVLAVFNLLPVPPLDGSALIERVLPQRLWPQYLRLRQYSMPLLLVLVLVVPGALARVFDPAIGFWLRLL